MKYLLVVALMVVFPVLADDSPYCMTKGHLARDMASQILQGLDPSRINFAFPNVRSPEDAERAQKFADELMTQVLELIKTEDDPVKIYNTVKDNCEDPYEIKI
tara:strand:+ start:202 stop:510 length:309 start_codon:yes stop_codon:yes gene_type:complete